MYKVILIEESEEKGDVSFKFYIFREDFIENVKKVREYILVGDIF